MRRLLFVRVWLRTSLFPAPDAACCGTERGHTRPWDAVSQLQQARRREGMTRVRASEASVNGFAPVRLAPLARRRAGARELCSHGCVVSMGVERLVRWRLVANTLSFWCRARCIRIDA